LLLLFVIVVVWLVGLHRLEMNKGIGLETIHYLNDGLWHMKSLK